MMKVLGRDHSPACLIPSPVGAASRRGGTAMNLPSSFGARRASHLSNHLTTLADDNVAGTVKPSCVSLPETVVYLD
jgi:hypothetical protein